MDHPAPEDLFGAPDPRVFSIDAGRPFLDDLASGLFAAVTGDPLQIARMRVYLPTRRAARALGDAFLRAAERAGRRATALPEVRVLGDVDDDEAATLHEDAEEAASLPPAVSAILRKVALARLVAARDRAFAGAENWAGAFAAAGELAALLDSFYTEEVPFDVLKRLAPEAYAAHWGRSLDFLEIATAAWPAYLQEIGAMDPAERRVRLIRAETRRLAARPPEGPVIVAGTTGSTPAVADLARMVARLERGAVALPGLDRALASGDPAGWTAVDDSHPQAGLKALLSRIDIPPAAVRVWPSADADPQTDRSGARVNLGDARRRLLSIALRPAEVTGDWRGFVAEADRDDPGLAAACAGLSLAEVADEEAEASAIALAMRETLETPRATALLVTPDRDLARRVSARLRRWQVTVDDSGGVPIANTQCGVFLRLVARWLVRTSDPQALLAMARSPLCAFGLAYAARGRAVDALDEGLRGVAPAGDGFGVIVSRLAATDRKRRDEAGAIAALCAAESHWRAAGAGFADRLGAHLAVAEALAASSEASGAERLWRGEDGETGAGLAADLLSAAPAIETPEADYPAVFEALLAGTNVRPRTGAHPRLAILGPLEARLQTADLIILGGLNEGVWPADAGADPFLSRPMRAVAGLPSPERRIGLAAHDFAQGAAAPRVLITRADRAAGKPTKASRWLLRLRNLLKGAGALAAVDGASTLRLRTASLDAAGEPQPAGPPRFAPPLAARPRKLPVTQIETLLRDPYAVYARSVLRLRRLDRLAEPFEKRRFGSLLHRVFEIAAREAKSPHDAFAAVAAEFGYTPDLDAFWRPEINAALDWFAEFDRSSRAASQLVFLEDEGRIEIQTALGAFTLTARADRIDIDADGAAHIIDYKSRSLPTLSQTKAQFSPQLPLTGLIVIQGGFEALGPRPVKRFAYVRMLGRKDEAKDNETGAADNDALALIGIAEHGLRTLLDAFADEKSPYLSKPRPEFMRDYGDYDHLARRGEWATQAEDE